MNEVWNGRRGDVGFICGRERR